MLRNRTLTNESYYAGLESEIYSSLDAVGPLYERSFYDTLGRTDYVMDYKQQATKYFYDTQGRLEYKRYYEADGDLDGDNENMPDSYVEEIAYTYDTLGRQETVTDTTGTITYYYDNEGRIHVIDSPQGVIEYLYNAVTGSKTAVVSYAADTLYEDIVDDTATPVNSTTYGYDDLGRLDNVNDTVSYGYTAVGSRETMEIDTDGSTGWELRTSYAYNSLNRLTSLVNEKTTATVVSSFDYTLAADGMREAADEFLEYPASQTDEDPSIDYTYDNLNRLTQETHYNTSGYGYTADYTYDLVGNRQSRTVEVTNSAGTYTLTTAYTYDTDTDRLLTEENEGPIAAIPYGDNQRIYAYANAPGGGITYQLPSSDKQIGQFRAFWMGLPSVWNTVLFYVVMILIPIIFFWPVFVRQWSRIRGSIDPLASPDLKLWHRMLCILLAYIFLVGPDCFQMLSHASLDFSQLSTLSWGRGSTTIEYGYDANGSLTSKVTTHTDAGHTAEEVAYVYNLQNRLEYVTTTPYTAGRGE